MKYKSKILSLLTILILLVAGLKAQDMPPTLVVTAPVQKIKFNDQITLVGRSEAFYDSRVSSKVSGQVESIIALEGNKIPKDGPLIQIDSSRVALTLAAKRAQAEQAKSSATLAAGVKKRAEDLWERKLISELQIDSARAHAVTAEARYQELLAEQKRLELDLADCTISAPFPGYTGQKLVSVGEWVQVGAPVFEMTNLAKVKINVDLPERYFGQLAIGTEVTVLSSTDEEKPLRGTVTGFAPIATEETHTFPVIVTVDNAEGRLGSGMLVRAVLSLKATFSSLAVSKDAIVRQGSQTMVYTIVDGKAEPIDVTTSSNQGDLVAITGPGITEGMPVVVRGNERISKGAPVMTADVPPQNGKTKQ